jgi:uncharacterized protein with PIN domain
MRRHDEDDAQSILMRCAVCNGPMRLVSVERSVVGIPTDMERHTIKCFVCGFAMVRVSGLEEFQT